MKSHTSSIGHSKGIKRHSTLSETLSMQDQELTRAISGCCCCFGAVLGSIFNIYISIILQIILFIYGCPLPCCSSI